MVGDVGRTELATHPEIGARQLFGTIQRLKELPEYLEILPGAYAGSVCGRALSGKAVSTIGFERRFSRAFQINAVEQFVEFMLQNIPVPPPNAAAVRALNQGQKA
jgi:hydroxyacylglutathione hydrolase